MKFIQLTPFCPLFRRIAVYRNCSRLIAASATVALTAGTASAATILPTEDFGVKRADTTPGSGATLENLLHAKRFDSNTSVNRFVMIRFDSTLFGALATSAEFQITVGPSSSWTIPAAGSNQFKLWGVNDGDLQDEAVVQASYDPDASVDNIFNAGNPPVKSAQLTDLGNFTANLGDTVTINNAALLAFVQADTNDIVTLVITRNLNNSGNSVFADSTSITPPSLTVEAVPEPGSLALLGLGGLAMLRRRRN